MCTDKQTRAIPLWVPEQGTISPSAMLDPSLHLSKSGGHLILTFSGRGGVISSQCRARVKTPSPMGAETLCSMVHRGFARQWNAPMCIHFWMAHRNILLIIPSKLASAISATEFQWDMTTETVTSSLKQGPFLWNTWGVPGIQTELISSDNFPTFTSSLAVELIQSDTCVHLCIWVCVTYIVHHFNGTELSCAPSTCIVHQRPALCTITHESARPCS